VNSDRISVRQLRALFLASVLSPGIRLIPNSTVHFAGSASWLSPLAALIPVLLYCLFPAAVLAGRKEGESLRETVFSAVGRPAGMMLFLLLGAWLSFYTGFLLRVDAERLHATIFKEGRVLIFAAAGLVLIVTAARGKVRALARLAEVCVPLLIGVFVFSCVLAIADVKTEYLLPVTKQDLPGVLAGAVPVLNVFAVLSYFLLFMGETEKGTGIRQLFLRSGFWSVVGACAVTVTVVGVLSAPLANHLNNPFFVMARNLSVLGTNERVEAVVIALWVVTDLIYAAAVLRASANAVHAAVQKGKVTGYVWITAAGALAGAVFCAKDAFVLSRVSEYIVPAINLFFTCILFPVLFLVGAIRKKHREKKRKSTTSGNH